MEKRAIDPSGGVILVASHDQETGEFSANLHRTLVGFRIHHGQLGGQKLYAVHKVVTK
jgi:hypothetical protein